MREVNLFKNPREVVRGQDFGGNWNDHMALESQILDIGQCTEEKDEVGEWRLQTLKKKLEAQWQMPVRLKQLTTLASNCWSTP